MCAADVRLHMAARAAVLSAVGGGDATKCPNCGNHLVPVNDPNVADALAAFTCGRCGFTAGSMVSVGAALTNCPGCGAPIPA
jgi:predicted RNA-binding Zn-ribbon protein involved in translation (DUF1610 family)